MFSRFCLVVVNFRRWGRFLLASDVGDFDSGKILGPVSGFTSKPWNVFWGMALFLDNQSQRDSRHVAGRQIHGSDHARQFAALKKNTKTHPNCLIYKHLMVPPKRVQTACPPPAKRAKYVFPFVKSQVCFFPTKTRKLFSASFEGSVFISRHGLVFCEGTLLRLAFANPGANGLARPRPARAPGERVCDLSCNPQNARPFLWFEHYFLGGPLKEEHLLHGNPGRKSGRSGCVWSDQRQGLSLYPSARALRASRGDIFSDPVLQLRIIFGERIHGRF